MAAVPAAAQTTVRVSVGATGEQANGPSRRPSISADGRFVAFESTATNLTPDDTNGRSDVFVRDLVTGTTTRVSLNPADQPFALDADHAAISPDGRYVAFRAKVMQQSGGGAFEATHIYLRDIRAGRTYYVEGGASNDQLGPGPAVSAGGRFVAFPSQAAPLFSTGEHPPQIFLRDRIAGTTTRISPATDLQITVGQPSMDSAGRHIAFPTIIGCAAIFCFGEYPAARSYDRVANTSLLVAGGGHFEGRDEVSALGPGLSANGRYIAYVSNYSSVEWRIALFDRETSSRTWLPFAYPRSLESIDPVPLELSGNGRFVGFSSAASDLIAGDTNGQTDVFVFDRDLGATHRVSVATGGAQAGGASVNASMSATGQSIAFESEASNLTAGDSNGAADVFVHQWSPSGGGDPVPCLFDVSVPPSVASTAGGITLDVTTTMGCAWQAVSASPWITVSSGGGTTSGAATLAIAANDGPASRTGFVDVAGHVVAIVQEGAPCALAVTPTDVSLPASGGTLTFTVTTSRHQCPWATTKSPSDASWITVVESASMGNGTVQVTFAANAAGPRSALVGVHTSAPWPASVVWVTVVQASPLVGGADNDSDGLPNDWETRFGLNPNSGSDADGAFGDSDQDGVSNLHEYQAGTHPRGIVTRYLAEGAGNGFFATSIAILNPSPTTPVRALLRVQPEGEAERTRFFLVPAHTRLTVSSAELPTLLSGAFSSVIEADGPLVVDRTMTWGATGYGAHAETAIESPSTTWYLAEGATAGDFSLFYLLQNPNADATTATVRYLRPAPLPPIERSYPLPPHSRTTIPVDAVAPELAEAAVSGVITAPAPIIVERAMYLSRPGEPFAAGHESAGVTAMADTWFLAEGATGDFFELFVLIANPNASAAAVTIDYLLEDGTTLSKDYTVDGESRFTIWVDEEPFAGGAKLLTSQSLSLRVRSTNGVPIIVERSMWWPQGAWYEAHNSPGTTVTGTRWGLAGGTTGRAGSGPAWQTYVLIANTSSFAGQARVTVYLETGASATQTVNLAAQSRTSVGIQDLFPSTANARFGVVVESLGSPTPPQIVVERAMYASVSGLLWSTGTNALATRLAP